MSRCSFELKHFPYSLPSPQVKKLYSRYAKIYHKLVCPQLTLMQAQHIFIKEVGFFNWNDYINGGFTDSQRLSMFDEWLKDFRKKRNYQCESL